MNWLSKFKKKELPSLDFSILKTDIHSHLIPGIDDGAQNLDESLELILALQELGFSKFITTPHIMSDFYKNTPEIINNGLSKVKDALNTLNIDTEIAAAAEYYIDFEFQNDIGEKEYLTFGNRYILVEISFLESPNNLKEIIFNLQLEGYNVVLAHPERYLYFTLKEYKELSDRGILLQLNLLSITGYYSEEVKKQAEQLIDNDLISLVGTDCHNMKHVENLKKCFTNSFWHKLSQSEKLLNKIL